MRRRRDRPGDALRVDVAEVLEREAVRGELPAELPDRDSRLDAHLPGAAVDVEHAAQATELQHHPVGQGDVAEGVPRPRHADTQAPAGRLLDRGSELLDRRRRAHGSRGAALVAGPVAPSGGAHVRIARLAHQMNEPEPTLSPAVRASRGRSLPTPGLRRATVIGAGSFGTALAVLLSRAGLRTVLQTRTREQAQLIDSERENRVY